MGFLGLRVYLQELFAARMPFLGGLFNIGAKKQAARSVHTHGVGDLGLRVQVWGLVFFFKGPFFDCISESLKEGLGFRVWGLGFRVYGFGDRTELVPKQLYRSSSWRRICRSS